MLQQVATKIEIDPRKYLTTIHSKAGVGKTSFGQQVPGHYFMVTEHGIQGVEVFGDPIFSWKEYIAKCNEIVDTRDRGWKDKDGKPQREITTVVIDVYEVLYFYAAEWVCKEYTFPEKGVQHKFKRIEDVPYGKGYTRTNELIIHNLNQLMLLGFGVLVISHTKERQIKWAGQDFQHYGPNLPPSAAQALIDASGAVGYFYIEQKVERGEGGIVKRIEEGRRQRWQATFLIDAKHRLKCFPAELGLPMDKGYETYLAAFQEAVEKGKR